jgi:hypothetical protein
MVCIYFYEEALRYVWCVSLRRVIQFRAVDSNSKLPECNETSIHPIQVGDPQKCYVFENATTIRGTQSH